MENVLNFIGKNYIVFIVISVILLLALIGYIAEKIASKDAVIKKKKEAVLTDKVEEKK